MRRAVYSREVKTTGTFLNCTTRNVGLVVALIRKYFQDPQQSKTYILSALYVQKSQMWENRIKFMKHMFLFHLFLVPKIVYNSFCYFIILLQIRLLHPFIKPNENPLFRDVFVGKAVDVLVFYLLLFYTFAFVWLCSLRNLCSLRYMYRLRYYVTLSWSRR
jgi:hypothetical protein